MLSVKRQAWVLVVVGGLGALGAILGPGERWSGMDLGAAGAAVLVLCLVAAIVLFATKGDQVFPDDMSVSERRAWVGLTFVAVILVSYFRQMWNLSASRVVPEHIDDLFARQFISQLITLVIAWSAISYLVGRSVGGVEADERDLRLRQRAQRAADWAFTLIVIAGICVLASVQAQVLAWWLSPIVLANLLLGLLIAKSMADHVALAFAYRSGGA
jgi:hypothetical protein